jgi:signal transduction histidine kinase
MNVQILKGKDWMARGRTFLSRLVASRSKDKDTARREVILNILLVGSMVLSLIATVSALVTRVTSPYQDGAVVGTLTVFLAFVCAYALSKRGYSRGVAIVLVFIYLAATIRSSVEWGADVPQNLITFALVIVMAGILVNSSFSFLVTLVISTALLLLIDMQRRGIVSPDYGWRDLPPTIADGIVFSVTYSIIAVVSWLFNREMERALRRARQSEAALRKERDLLEERVEQRTEELKRLQFEKLGELYRFTEFGRLASGLFHDLVDPVNLVVMNLDELKRKHIIPEGNDAASRLLERVTMGTKQIEDFIATARRQMNYRAESEWFSPEDEIRQTLFMMAYRVKESRVKVDIDCQKGLTLYGVTIKFRQIITNLVANGIDSYDGIQGRELSERRILISMKGKPSGAVLEIRDWGKGIRGDELGKVFDPWFTTKERGTGLGLYIVRDVIETEFNGTIDVSSRKNEGTTFTIRFPHRER